MAQYVFAVDLGGTTVKLGLFDSDGNVLDKWEIVTRKENNGEKILPDIAKSIQDKAAEKSIAKEDILGVGIGVPGPVDSKGTIYKAANLGWDVFNVSETLGDLTGLPVKTGNDANVAALGEMWKGGGKGFNSIVAVTLGTGVGGGVIIEGKLVAGSTGAGGEIGHIHVEDNETMERKDALSSMLPQPESLDLPMNVLHRTICRASFAMRKKLMQRQFSMP